MKKFISKITKRKVLLIYLLILSFTLAIIFTTIFSYFKVLNNFKTSFNSGQFYKSNEIIINEQKLNPFKHLLLNSDLEKYFINYMKELNSKYEKNEISDLQILSILSEMERYSPQLSQIKDFKASFDIIKESKETFNVAVKKFNDKDYIAAFNSFNKVLPFDPNYLKVISYKQNISKLIKEDSLKTAEDLIKDRYYSKAITLLEENMIYYGNNKKVLEKIDEYAVKRDEILNKKNNSKNEKLTSNSKNISDASKEKAKESSALSTQITSQNINSLDIHSDTKYLVHVNLKNQNTYIYKGKKNNWDLDKKFLCSTGVTDKETPTGIYTTKKRGDWFYEPKYEQGGKYWVTFIDGYMFHSLPFAKDKKTIVDTTLGKAASHGCIRLAVEDAKWLYDNIPIGSKIIIN